QVTPQPLAAVDDLEELPPDVDRQRLRGDLERLRERYLDVPLQQLDARELVPTFFGILRRHRVRVPADLALVGKTLLTLQGVVARLDPQLSLIDLARPLGHRLVREHYAPQ